MITMAEETAEKKRKTRDEIAGLNWEGSNLSLMLFDPKNNLTPTAGYGIDVRHMEGPTYDYYWLKNPMPGNWTFKIVSIDVEETGEKASLFSGPVAERTTIHLSTFGR
jgi:hypothetical protein